MNQTAASPLSAHSDLVGTCLSLVCALHVNRYLCLTCRVCEDEDARGRS
jgi:hypothetical protein